MPNNKRDYSVGFEQSQGKVIAEIICKEIDTSLNENGATYQRAKRNENLYAQITKWMQAGKVPVTPWRGAADYFVPMVEWIVDAVWGRVLKSIFGKRPYMQAKGVESSDVTNEEAVTDFNDQILSEKVQIYDKLKYLIKQMLKLPFAVIKFCWVYENDVLYQTENAIVFVSPDGAMQEQVLPDEQDKALTLTTQGFVP